MTFSIDTGSPLFSGAREFIPDWLQDQCPSEYTDAQVVQAYAHHIIGNATVPKKVETVRKHLLMNWRFIAALGEESPALFDEVLTAYVERATAFD